MSRDILVLAKLKKRGRPFLEGPRRGATFWDYTQEHLVVIRDEKVSPFVKFEIILPLLCFLLDSLTNNDCRTWTSEINLWIDSRTYQKSCRQQSKGLAITYNLQKKMFWGNMMLLHWPCFTWMFFVIWFHQILKIVLQTQPLCHRNICTEHWRNLPNLTAFLEIFLYLKNNDSVEHV